MMRKMFFGIVGIVAAAPGASAQDADHGRQIFMQDGCYECHGMVGQGSPSGPRLAPVALTADAIIRYIRNPPGVMPPYSPRVISNSDIADIHAYLATIKKPTVKLPE